MRKLLMLSIILGLTACRAATPDEAVQVTPQNTPDINAPFETVTPPANTNTQTETVTPPSNTNTQTGELIEVESNRDGVFTISVDGSRLDLTAPNETFLEVGAGIDVDEFGRAILRFADLLTIEVLRDGELRIQEISLDDQAAVVTVLQNGGALLNEFDPTDQIERRFTIETEFATITSTGTRFLIASEADSPLEWIVGLDAGENDLQITSKANGVTKSVTTGVARWVAPIGDPSAGIEAQMGNVDAWLNQLQNGGSVTEIGEVVWSAADVQATTGRLTAVPPLGEPFSLGTAVPLTLAQPTSPNGSYWLDDCNQDGLLDIAMRDGLLLMDFRDVNGRTRALDVSVFNRSDSYAGNLRLLDPERADLANQTLRAGQNQSEIVSLRPDEPFHYAELTLTDGCFLGFSLTPPDANGNPGAPRSDIDIDNTDTNSRPPGNGSLVAWPVGRGGYDVSMQIDNETADWDALYQQLNERGEDGLYYPFDDIVFDSNCAAVGDDFGTDLSAGVRFAYDEEYLYAAFIVFDEFFKSYNGSDQGFFFLGDSPQLLLDLDLAGDFNDHRNSADDIQLDFYPGSSSSPGLPSNALPAQVALWHLGETPATPTILWQALVTAIPLQGGRSGGGYFLETAVPWSALGVTPQAGLEFGVAASVSDDDTAVGNDQECMISTSPNRLWQDPTTWGTLLLAAPP